jgi:hypothetical protein
MTSKPWRKYQAVWHKLLSFTYRLVVLRQGPRLHFKLTPAQLHAFSQVTTQNNYSDPTQCMSPPSANAALENSPHHALGPSVSPVLQNVCLQLCLSLLDHKLHGKLSDSIVVGFLAALGINKERNGLDGQLHTRRSCRDLLSLRNFLSYSMLLLNIGRGESSFRMNWSPNSRIDSLCSAVIHL